MNKLTEPGPGDVVLVRHQPGFDNLVSTLIQKVTGSPYSHAILCLGDGEYADARPRSDARTPDGDVARVPDIATFDDSALEDKLCEPGNNGMSLLLLRSNNPADSHLVRKVTNSFVLRSADPKDPLIFSDGDLAALAVLNAVLGNGLVRSMETTNLGESSHRRRLAGAIIFTLEDGDRRLFCSEFVHRVLDECGRRPHLPASPTIPLGGFPTDEPMRGFVGFLDAAEAWLRERWDGLLDQVLNHIDLDRESLMTFDEVWSRVVNAYREEKWPTRATVANFFTPADFAASPSFDQADRPTRVAHGGWVAQS